MESGILVLTQKGRAALETPPPELSPLCRNILVQIDGKKSMIEINTMFRGLKGLEETVQKLLDGNYIQVSRECRDLVKSLAHQLLGPKAPAFIMKIDEAIRNDTVEAAQARIDTVREETWTVRVDQMVKAIEEERFRKTDR